MSENITRPIIGIENRTAQEVFDIMVARIGATPPPLPIVMGVKPLEWTTAALQHSYGLVIRIGQTPFGAYHILKGRQGKFEVYFTTVPLSGAIDDEAEALAWAQSDYERRIRAALPSPMEGGE
jgi:hypothetical protein